MEDRVLLALVRMAERLLVVGIAGMAVYLGFRLFQAVPTQESGGRIELPKLSVVFSKVGPGVFFAAFGCAVLVNAIGSPVEIAPDRFAGGLPVGAASFASPVAAPPAAAPPSVQEIAAVQQAARVLNCLAAAGSPPEALRPADVEKAVEDAKLALIASVWDAEGWGPLGEFRAWVRSGSGRVAPGAEALFQEVYPACR